MRGNTAKDKDIRRAFTHFSLFVFPEEGDDRILFRSFCTDYHRVACNRGKDSKAEADV